ncbi:MAG: peptide chain release factor N(5)-glutamine methyltransferase [Verrucomicrobia bacterium]|nr:peptide chain release factor N(5)-glutamine methyltransferase [Verrucomicrobiota bacterium]MBU6445818.1 peptide chain release factor N(5)-glutamine methyltransferase [Verrucomicrobiota bacterium]MDE3048026.1 peptide chain release factor N(5)-glutamine methyltransferase [Verrucomicrobiota bacterium]
MKTIGEIVTLSGQFLAKLPRGKRIAEEIIADVLGMTRMDLYLQFDRPLVESELTHIRAKLKRCAKNEPVEYILGAVDFFGCRIQVDPRVLIPRPETEILVEKIAKQAKTGVLWDVCCGSGCIGISLKKANPHLQVVLSDIDKGALAVAAQNAALNGVEVTFVHGDLLEPFQGQKADWIVCNPPYVTEEEYQRLDPSVKDFEPKIALVGGISVYERLAHVADFLNPMGAFFFEIGCDQKTALQTLFPKATIECDWAGHPRFLFAQKS